MLTQEGVWEVWRGQDHMQGGLPPSAFHITHGHRTSSISKNPGAPAGHRNSLFWGGMGWGCSRPGAGIGGGSLLEAEVRSANRQYFSILWAQASVSHPSHPDDRNPEQCGIRGCPFQRAALFLSILTNSLRRTRKHRKHSHSVWSTKCQ